MSKVIGYLQSVRMNDMKIEVTVCVLSYNSSNYICETLESIKRQSLEKIELLICDDCSKDNTLEICENWIRENSNRFVECRLISSNSNMGIPSNLNKGILCSHGTWIKIIAADDILFDDCLEKNYNYVCLNPDIEILFSRVDFFSSGCMDCFKVDSLFDYSFFDLTVNEKYEYLLSKRNCIPAPTSFIRKETIEKLGYFDESITLLEDYPMWLKALKSGINLCFYNVVTVRYRIHPSSISISPSRQYWKCQLLFYQKYIYPFLIKKSPLNALDRYLVLKKKSSQGVVFVFFSVLRICSLYSYIRIYKRWMK